MLQLVVDSSTGEVFGCEPVNGAGVSLWSSMPATAQLRSESYQQQYQSWLQKLSVAAETGQPCEVRCCRNLRLPLALWITC